MFTGSPLNGLLFFDIEADNFLYDASNIWCIVGFDGMYYHIYHPDDGSTYKYPSYTTVYHSINEYTSYIYSKVLVGHNIISYDLPLLTKLTGFKYEVNPDKLIDTHILSRLYYPDREGHSLEWWGNKFRFKKGDHKDFTQFSQEMLDYCVRDVDITRRLYYTLMEEGKDWDWSEAIKLEYNIWDIQMRQEMRGVAFDKDRAEEVLAAIVKELDEIESKVIPEIPLRLQDDGEIKKVFMKNGTYTKPVEVWLEGERRE